MDDSSKTSHVALNPQLEAYLLLGQSRYPVFSFSGSEALSQGFDICAQVYDVAGHDALLQPACLEIISGVSKRIFSGAITQVRSMFSQQPYRELRLQPRLALLQYQRGPKVYLSCNVVDVVTQTLLRGGYQASQLNWCLTQSYPIKAQLTRSPDESELAFVNRLLAQAGIFYVTGVDAHGNERLSFYETNAQLPWYSEHDVVYQDPSELVRPEVGAVQSRPGVYGISPGSKRVPDKVSVLDYDEQSVNPQVLGSAWVNPDKRDASHVTEWEVYGSGCLTQEEALKEASLRAQVLRWQQHWVWLESHLVDLAVGQRLSLAANRFDRALNGIYVTQSIEHQFHVSPGIEQGGVGQVTYQYHQRVKLIPSQRDFKAPLSEVPEMPSISSAQIETPFAGNPYAHLDKQGHYRLRYHFDDSSQPQGQASKPIAKLSSHVGPLSSEGPTNKSQPSGWHLPLTAGTQVLLSHVNHHPDRPVILGAIPNARNISNVTQKNPMQNRLDTPGGHHFVMDDTKNHPYIQLGTANDLNHILLDAHPQMPKIQIQSQQGTVNLNAKQSMTLQSGKNTYETTEASRHHTAGENHLTQVGGDVHHQVKQDYRAHATQNIHLSAKDDFTLATGKAFQSESGHDIKFESQTGDILIQAPKGSVNIISGDDIHIQGTGKGRLHFGHQAGSGFFLDPDGSVTFYGNTVGFKAKNNLTIKGKVNYHPNPIGSPDLEAVIPPSISPLPEVKIKDNKPTIKNYHFTHQVKEVDYQGKKHPKKGLHYQLTYSDGKKQAGQLNNSGEAKHTNIPPGAIKVTYGLTATDAKLNSAADLHEKVQQQQEKLQQVLNKLLEKIKTANAKQTKEYHDSNIFKKAYLIDKAEIKGATHAAIATVEGAVKFIKDVTLVVGNVGILAFDNYTPDKLKAKQALAKDWQAIKHTVKAGKKAAQFLYLYATDKSTRDILNDFAKQAFAALSPQAKAYYAAEGVVFAAPFILMLITTGGLGDIAAGADVAEETTQASTALEDLSEAKQALEAYHTEESTADEVLVNEHEAKTVGFGDDNADNTPELFENQFPEHEIYNPKIISNEKVKVINGKWNYVVLTKGKLIIGKRGQFPGGGHIDLANGMPVKVAGEVRIVNGEIKYIDNSSGHYLPYGPNAQKAAEKAFQKLGFNIKEKYIEKEWVKDKKMQNGGVWRTK